MEEACNLIVVSDFHLSDHPPTPSSHKRDERFAALIDHLILESAREKQPLRLVILGDFLDFLQAMRQGVNRADSAEPAALVRLERIADAHWLIFDALRRFARSGLTIDFLPGNHDLDLLRPALQQRLKELVLGSAPGLAGSVNFFPWIYYIPGVLYAEHGHQHHDINCTTTLLAPYIPGKQDQIELPPGAHFEFYLQDLFEKLSLPVQMANRPLASLANVYRKNPVNLLIALPEHWRFLVQGLKFMVGLISPQTRARRAAYRQGMLPLYAHSLGLGAHTVIAIDRLSESSPFRILQRIARLVARHPTQKTPGSDYLYQAAQKVHLILEAEGQSVPFYVFGHAHDAKIAPLIADSASSATYVNCGTWIEKDLSAGENHVPGFPYVKITRHTRGAEPAVELCFW